MERTVSISDALRESRRLYTSLEQFVAEEGVEAMLAFLSTHPTQSTGINGVKGKYRHTKMDALPCSVHIKYPDTKPQQTRTAPFLEDTPTPKLYRPYPTAPGRYD